MSTPRVWFITGASSGIGLEMTRRVLKNGDIAVATLRQPSALATLAAQYPTTRLLVLKVDVTVPSEITAAFARVQTMFGRLDVVFNNAGYAVLGEVEGTPDEAARAMFEVNFWGTVHVAQAAVKFFREVNPPGVGGRLIQISSGCGVVGWPACGFYAATKHALEGLSESLALELDPAWNIKVTIVPLGAFKTNAIAVGMVKLPGHAAYNDPKLPSVSMRTAILSTVDGEGEKKSEYEAKGDAAKAAEAFYRLSEDPSPPLRLALGKDVIGYCRNKIKSFTGELDAYESWSEGMERE